MGYTNAAPEWARNLEGIMANDFDITRWRSFAERYLVERAATFEPGKEVEGIWTEVNNALAAYQHIYHVGVANEGEPMGQPADIPAFRTDYVGEAVALTSLPADKAWYAKLKGTLGW